MRARTLSITGRSGSLGKLEKVAELADLGFGHLGSSSNGRTLPTYISTHDLAHLSASVPRLDGLRGGLGAGRLALQARPPRLRGGLGRQGRDPRAIRHGRGGWPALSGCAALRLPAADRGALAGAHDVACPEVHQPAMQIAVPQQPLGVFLAALVTTCRTGPSRQAQSL